MGTIINQNNTNYYRCPKDEEHPFTRLSAKLFALNGYQLAIMAQILSNKDGWKLVKKEISKRVDFPRKKFNDAWKSLIDEGYINSKKAQRGCLYNIYEDPDFTSTTGSTSKGGMLTTINNNYNIQQVKGTRDSTYEKEFQELLSLYPDMGLKKDGSTYPLKGNLGKCSDAYNKYLRTNNMTHDQIMTALKVELNEKQSKGDLSFQKGLLRWIEENTFEQYKGRKLEPIEPVYGQTLV